MIPNIENPCPNEGPQGTKRLQNKALTKIYIRNLFSFGNVKITEPKYSKKDGIKINTRLQGIIFGEITKDMPEYGKINGIKIIKIKKNSRAYAVGIRVNDIILSINNIPVQAIKDLEIVSGENDSELVVHVQRGNRTAFLLLK